MTVTAAHRHPDRGDRTTRRAAVYIAMMRHEVMARRRSLDHPLTGVLAALGAALLLRLNLSSVWLVLLGGLAGFAYKAVAG